ncbi:type VI secretion system tip protein VgrG [Hymenobacter convexus]|uniref:type VI secretion system tip protein VgrG n=1 Tax=Hymenobacter sp. CA1UV-4 TaxID=3063782 RepID=UPI002713F23D|nr:type VI secretion system tip protein VgrG [Hymenobacter sp. CA1UV-4]MDO7854088.1 type VI secretion system tip protein VgrG [Hymenobacter sp. CA1UV-4]
MIVTTTITSDGTGMPAAYELLSIDVSSEYNRVPTAELVLLDGNPATRAFPISDSAFFEPGKEISISLRYEGLPNKEVAVFKGIVLKQGLRLDREGCTLEVELSDLAVKMTSLRKSNVFAGKTDSAIIAALIRANSLTAGSIGATEVEHQRIVQYQATDWDFMLLRAAQNGLLVAAAGGTISATPPAIAAARQTFEFGLTEIFDFQMEVDARYQVGAVKSASWDAKRQELTATQEAAPVSLSQGNLKPAALAEAVGASNQLLLTGTALQDGEAKAWADATLLRSRLAMVRGSFRVPGLASLALGDTIELKGLTQRFSGKTIVTGLRHQVNAEGWFTSIQFGLSPIPFAATPGIADSPASGMLPGISGLQIGIVQKYEEDPNKEHRVKIMIPVIGQASGLVWGRLAAPDAGKNRGLFFWPEPGDEVILGFLNDDPRQPVILGALYSSANQPPWAPADTNAQKGLVTKGGTTLLFDDEKKLVSLATADGSSITLDEDKKSVEIKDSRSNVIRLTADGIVLESGKDVFITSKGTVHIEGTKGVEIKGAKIDIK